MPSVVESLDLISKTMEGILDFVASDKVLSEDFKTYLEKNNIEIETEKEFNNVIIQYMLEEKMQTGLRVLEYYRRNNKSYDEIVDALQNSFCAVFRIDKILSNAYDVTCLTSNAKIQIMPMVKMNHLKQIGRYDYIQARIIELCDTKYILEIYDVISEFDVSKATRVAIKYMIQNPKSAYYKNDDKKSQLQDCVLDFYNKFQEFFKKDFIVTTNKKIDELMALFNNYRLTNNKQDYNQLIEKNEKYRYFNVDEYNSSSDNFIENALGGFANHTEIYDVALFIDKKRGLFVIPFFDTFLKSFDEDIEGGDECIKSFLTSDKIPPSVLKYACEHKEKFFDRINEIMGTEFTNLEEILFNTKTVFLDDGVYSPVITLFNSELFTSSVNVEKSDNINKTIGRNDACPCGSGLKYKNCCMKKNI